MTFETPVECGWPVRGCDYLLFYPHLLTKTSSFNNKIQHHWNKKRYVQVSTSTVAFYFMLIVLSLATMLLVMGTIANASLCTWGNSAQGSSGPQLYSCSSQTSVHHHSRIGTLKTFKIPDMSCIESGGRKGAWLV